MCSLELCMYVYISVVCVCDWLAVVFRMRVCFSNIFVSFSITKMRPRPRPALTVLTIYIIVLHGHHHFAFRQGRQPAYAQAYFWTRVSGKDNC
jgi:hypothetical protein